MFRRLLILPLGLVLATSAVAFSPDDSDFSFGNRLVDAVNTNNVDIVKAMLMQGEDPNQPGKFETSALHRAAFNDNPELVTLLLANGADVNIRDYGGASPLHIAARQGSTTVATTLLRKGANINAKDNQGYTPLHRAISNNKTEVSLMLISSGANVNTENKEGNTPLIDAVRVSNPVLVKELIVKGANRNVKNGKGLDALDYAMKMRNPAVDSILSKSLAELQGREDSNDNTSYGAPKPLPDFLKTEAAGNTGELSGVRVPVADVKVESMEGFDTPSPAEKNSKPAFMQKEYATSVTAPDGKNIDMTAAMPASIAYRSYVGPANKRPTSVLSANNPAPEVTPETNAEVSTPAPSDELKLAPRLPAEPEQKAEPKSKKHKKQSAVPAPTPAPAPIENTQAETKPAENIQTAPIIAPATIDASALTTPAKNIDDSNLQRAPRLPDNGLIPGAEKQPEVKEEPKEQPKEEPKKKTKKDKKAEEKTEAEATPAPAPEPAKPEEKTEENITQVTTSKQIPVNDYVEKPADVISIADNNIPDQTTVTTTKVVKDKKKKGKKQTAEQQSAPQTAPAELPASMKQDAQKDQTAPAEPANPPAEQSQVPVDEKYAAEVDNMMNNLDSTPAAAPAPATPVEAPQVNDQTPASESVTPPEVNLPDGNVQEASATINSASSEMAAETAQATVQETAQAAPAVEPDKNYESEVDRIMREATESNDNSPKAYSQNSTLDIPLSIRYEKRFHNNPANYVIKELAPKNLNANDAPAAAPIEAIQVESTQTEQPAAPAASNNDDVIYTVTKESLLAKGALTNDLNQYMQPQTPAIDALAKTPDTAGAENYKSFRSDLVNNINQFYNQDKGGANYNEHKSISEMKVAPLVTPPPAPAAPAQIPTSPDTTPEVRAKAVLNKKLKAQESYGGLSDIRPAQVTPVDAENMASLETPASANTTEKSLDIKSSESDNDLNGAHAYVGGFASEADAVKFYNDRSSNTGLVYIYKVVKSSSGDYGLAIGTLANEQQVNELCSQFGTAEHACGVLGNTSNYSIISNRKVYAQIGSFTSEDIAKKYFETKAKEFSDSFNYKTVVKGFKNVLLQVGPVTSGGDAKKICDNFTETNKTCEVSVK